jgi:Cys-tRNA(Pro)/Cys-tRNA(Cys) deacylase
MGKALKMNELHKNVRSAISKLGTEYKIHDHSKLSSEIRNPNDFAAALGYPIQRITKTLFLRSHDGQTYAAAVCSMNRRLNFKLTANAIGTKRVEVASSEDLQVKTSYPRNGVSPLGLAEDITVVVDRLLLDYPTVLIGGGATEIEIELSPSGLVRISGATVESITA